MAGKARGGKGRRREGKRWKAKEHPLPVAHTHKSKIVHSAKPIKGFWGKFLSSSNRCPATLLRVNFSPMIHYDLYPLKKLVFAQFGKILFLPSQRRTHRGLQTPPRIIFFQNKNYSSL